MYFDSNILKNLEFSDVEYYAHKYAFNHSLYLSSRLIRIYFKVSCVIFFVERNCINLKDLSAMFNVLEFSEMLFS